VARKQWWDSDVRKRRKYSPSPAATQAVKEFYALPEISREGPGK